MMTLPATAPFQGLPDGLPDSSDAAQGWPGSVWPGSVWPGAAEPVDGAARDFNPAGVPVRPLTAGEVEAFRVRLQTAGLAGGERAFIAVLAALERLKATAAGVQAAAIGHLEAAILEAETDRGVPEPLRGRGLVRQVGLATGQSPAQAQKHVRASRIWTRQAPFLYHLLCSGVVNEFRAMVAVNELAKLPAHVRRQADRLLFAPSSPYSSSWGSTKKLSVATRAVVAELDPANAFERHERERRATSGVSVSLGYDGMATLNAVMPSWQAASIASVIDQATSQVPYGSRGVAQVNELYARVTGCAAMNGDTADVTINLVISDATLLGAGHQGAAVLDSRGRGYGTIPAQVARNLIANGLTTTGENTTSVWLRRIYANPAGDLVAASSKQRFFADGLAAMLSIRDQGLCRTPGCDAVIRDLDHVVPHAEAGATDLMNGTGLCRRCNQSKETLGWTAATDLDPTTGRHRLTIVDPTGTRYQSTAPPLPAPALPTPALPCSRGHTVSCGGYNRRPSAALAARRSDREEKYDPLAP
jgi:hypothetical protein